VLLDGDQPAWLVLGYREVHYVTTNSDLFARDSRRWNRWSQIPADWPLLTAVGYKPSLYYAEGAEHRRRAGILHDVLATVDQLELQAHCERIADRLVDGFAGRGEADLVAQYAGAIPILVVAVMFGLSDAETSHLVRDLDESVSGRAGAVDAFVRVRELMERLIVRGRERPGPNVPSRFAAHPAGLTDLEIAEDLMMVIGGSQLTTSCWIGNTLRLMLVDDRFSLTLSGGRRSIGQALNQVLWEDTPV
nr:hypothetical protein [Micromonospora sp. DSM 115978]